jgi:hypothetical protein
MYKKLMVSKSKKGGEIKTGAGTMHFGLSHTSVVQKRMNYWRVANIYTNCTVIRHALDWLIEEYDKILSMIAETSLKD